MRRADNPSPTPPLRREGLPTRRPGLSLLEVLLALTILLMSMAAISQLVDFGSSRGVEARLHSLGTRLAQSKLAEVEAGVIAADSAASGEFETDPEWSWSVEPVAQDVPNVYQVTVKVSRDLRGRPFEVSLTQVIFDPSRMGSAAPAQKADPSSTTGGMSP